MALVKVCPNKNCGKVHPASAMFCDSEFCDMRDLTEVIPIPEEELRTHVPPATEPEQPSAPPKADTDEAELVLRHVDSGKTVAVRDGDIMGRHGEGREIFSMYPYVSRRHLKIYRQDELWCLMDIGSSNGTSVNGVSLGRDQACLLNKKDRITFADTCTLEVM